MDKPGFFTNLRERALAIDSLLCVGLDPRIETGPEVESAFIVQRLVEFTRRIVDETASYALCYKPNIAFFEAHGVPGMEALSICMETIPDGIPVILDAKRGDIGPTAEAYAQASFGAFGADAVTVNPYMGFDAVKPFLQWTGKGVFVLCKTSNPAALEIQGSLLANGEPTYAQVSDKIVSWGGNHQIGLVVAGNEPEILASLRERHPGTWFLAPGIGAQGGDAATAILHGADDEGLGIIPVVARQIASSVNPGKAAADFRDQIRRARDEKKAAAASSTGSSASSSGGKVAGSTATSPSANPAAPSADVRKFLMELVRLECFKTGSFVLKSGQTSPFYIDLRLIMSDSSLLRMAGRAYASMLFRESLRGIKFDRIAGIPSAGLPLAAAASLESGIPMIFPRLTAKDHGTGKRIEGAFKQGERVLLLDDLITSGSAKLDAVKVLREEGLVVEHLVVLLERGAKGRAELGAAGVAVEAFARVTDFFPLLEAAGRLTAQERAEMEAYAAT